PLRRQLREIECAAMIILFDSVSDAFESRRRMIELTCNLDPELRMPPDGVVINRDAAIGRDERTAFGQNERINLQRTRLDAACGGEQSLDRIGELSRMRG